MQDTLRLLKWLVYPALAVALWLVGRGMGRTFAGMSEGGVAEAAHLVVWFLGYVALGLALGMLAGWDISTWLGSVSERFIFGTGARSLRRDPRLRRAEELLAKREALAAIGVLREYLTDKPRDWQAAVRIAEIYLGPLQNPLAAVLEYEAILQRGRLPRAARPWVLLRLGEGFLYLDRGDAAIERFEEIIRKYRRSGAAAKARRRLAAGSPGAVQTDEAQPAPAAPPSEAGPVPQVGKLPPGFRPFDARHRPPGH